MKVKIANSASKKTREKIKKNFAILLKEKQSLNKITVTDLVSKADITRGSFYTHYENIYDVAKELQDETLEFLIHNIKELNSIENINSYFDEIFHYLKENEDIYSMILSCNEPLLFTDTLSKIMTKNLYEVLFDSHHQKNLELNISLFIDGSIHLLIKYYRKEISCSFEEINQCMKDTFKKLFLQEK